MVTVAREDCARVRRIQGDVTIDEMTSLVARCTAALSSPEVADDFSQAVTHICQTGSWMPNKETCGAAGVIPAIVSALLTHGAVSVGVAMHGCQALCRLGEFNTDNIDAIVLYSGGLDAILSVMVWMAGEVTALHQACYALQFIADFASPASLAAIRESRAVELIQAEKANHPTDFSLTMFADSALQEIMKDRQATKRFGFA